MKPYTLLSAIIFNSIFAFSQTSNLKNWNKTEQDGVLIYTPSNLSEGKIFRVTIPFPVDLGEKDLKEWFVTEAKSQQSLLGEPLDSWVVNPEKDNGWGTSNTYMGPEGEKMSVGYQGGSFEDGSSYILQMVSSQDIGILLKYGMQLNKVLKDAETAFMSGAVSVSQKPSAIETPPSVKADLTKESASEPKPGELPSGEEWKKMTGREKTKAIERAVRTLPGEGASPTDIVEVWVKSGLDLIGGGFDVDTYLLFKDGTAYLDCDVPPNELNVKLSRQLQSAGEVYKYGKWTTWRPAGSGYEVKEVRSGSWSKLEGNKAIPCKKNQKLDGKYISAGGSANFGAWKYYIIFKPDGRFEMSFNNSYSNSSVGGGTTGPLVTVIGSSDKEGTSSNSSVSGSNVGGGSSSYKKDGDKNTGTYYLDGYTITLKHDNGWEHTELFFFDEPGSKSVIYKDDKYWIEE